MANRYYNSQGGIPGGIQNQPSFSGGIPDVSNPNPAWTGGVPGGITHRFTNQQPARPGNKGGNSFVSRSNAAPDMHFLDASRVTEFALNTSDSEAAKNFGVQQHGLDDAQKKEVASIVGYASMSRPKTGGIGGFFAAIIEFFANMFRGPEERKEHAAEKARATALQVATTTYLGLETRGYSKLAARISGVEKDADGKFQPIADADGKHTGMYQREIDRSTNPAMFAINNGVDAGTVPSKEQSLRKQEIIDAGIRDIYTDPALRSEIKQYRKNLEKTLGKDDEASMFMAKPGIKEAISVIADKIAGDQTIMNGGRFRFKKEDVAKLLTRDLKANHKENFDKYEGVPSASTRRINAIMTSLPEQGVQLGAIGRFKVQEEAEGTDRIPLTTGGPLPVQLAKGPTKTF